MTTHDYLVEGYLIIRRHNRWWRSVKARWVTKRPTRLAVGEVPIRVVLSVPRELFEKPTYEVRGAVEMDTEVVLGELRARGIEVIAVAPPDVTGVSTPASLEGTS